MKIIRKGVMLSAIKRFECHNCGCIFEAEKSEYQTTSQLGVMHDGLGAYNCKCPCCGMVTYDETVTYK